MSDVVYKDFFFNDCCPNDCFEYDPNDLDGLGLFVLMSSFHGLNRPKRDLKGSRLDCVVHVPVGLTVNGVVDGVLNAGRVVVRTSNWLPWLVGRITCSSPFCLNRTVNGAGPENGIRVVDLIWVGSLYR